MRLEASASFNKPEISWTPHPMFHWLKFFFIFLPNFRNYKSIHRGLIHPLSFCLDSSTRTGNSRWIRPSADATYAAFRALSASSPLRFLSHVPSFEPLSPVVVPDPQKNTQENAKHNESYWIPFKHCRHFNFDVATHKFVFVVFATVALKPVSTCSRTFSRSTIYSSWLNRST